MKCDKCPLSGACKGEAQKWVCQVPEKAPSFVRWMGDNSLPVATESPTDYPSLTQQAKNFAGSMVKAAKDGFAKVDDEEAGRRLAICHGCDKFDVSAKACRLCGCYCNFKVRLKSQECPLGKWENGTKIQL